jgi:hypothetical protein
MERGGVCIEESRNYTSVSFRKNVQKLANSRILAKEFSNIVNADQCVRYVAFGYDDSTVKPTHFKCAAYKCDSSAGSCALSVNPMADLGDGINVTLSRKVCTKEGDSCYLGPLGVEEFYQNESVNGTCKNVTGGSLKSFRFPGEDCDENTDCFNDVAHPGLCYSGKCWGMNKTQTCNRTEQCTVGLFCNTTISQCVEQKQEGEFCVYGWDCENHLGCHNSTCKEFLSLKNGEVNNANCSKWALPEDVYGIGRRLLCEYGTTDTLDNQCTQYDYTGATAAKKDSNGFVPCERDEKCYYTDKLQFYNLTQTCQCGYNEQGQGYCPLPNSISKLDCM